MIMAAIDPTVQDHETVHVANQLSRVLIAHCWSKDDTIGPQLISVGSEMSWGFSVKYFATTHFWCDLAVEDKRVHFTAYKDDGRYMDTTRWVVNDTGVFAVYVEFFYPWIIAD
ncbi:Self-incompatibility protein S1 [Linum perenne]